MAWEEQQPERRRREPRGSKKSRNRGQAKNKDRVRNREFAWITYFFVILFIAMIGYIIYFAAFKADAFVNSPYNMRQDAFAKKIIRGSITDRNGEVLARTAVSDDGTETREYPYGDLFAHVVGYSNSKYGKTGLESAANFELLTSNTFFLEKIRNEFNGQKNQGDTVITTLDASLQEAASDALGDYRGAAIVMEADTGKILAMVSHPDFDPNDISSEWESLNTDEERSPLLNRATRGSYAPGSVFKIITALAYMRQNPDYADYTYECTGSVTVGDTTISCAGGTAHGLQDLRSSFANSCNCSFINIGLQLDLDGYRDTAEDLLFNSELPGVLGYSKGSFVLDEDSPESEIMMTAMGQGDTMVSPYQMLLITQAIANGGTLMEPYLIDAVTNYTGTEVSRNIPKSTGRLITSEEAAQLRDYMRAVVSEGTGSVLSDRSYTVAGKTGTAQYSTRERERSHSWFTGFTNIDDPELVITVVTEGSDGSRSGRAVSIAGEILDSYYN